MIKVLIIEDSEEIRVLEQHLFESEGAEVVGVATGDEGISCVQASLAHEQPFKLIILDIRLPDRSGYEIARELRNAGFKGTIAAVTANATLEGKVEGEESGVDLYFSKRVFKRPLVKALLEQHADQSRLKFFV